MTENSVSLERVPESMRDPMRDFAALVRQLAGPHAQALIAFGSIVAGSFDRTRHVARSVCIMDVVDLSVLRRLAEHGAKLGKARIAAPLIMTPAYIQASLDTFPLELIEIQQQHLTLFGEDPFQDLKFEDAHVRLQCERELKVILIGLRQGLLAAAEREKFIRALQGDVADPLLRTLRGLLWLRGDREPKPASAVVAQFEKAVDRKLPGIRGALDPAARHGWDEFESLYRDVEVLGGIADAW